MFQKNPTGRLGESKGGGSVRKVQGTRIGYNGFIKDEKEDGNGGGSSEGSDRRFEPDA